MLTLTFDTSAPVPGAGARRLVNVWRDDAGEVFARAFSAGDSHWIDWPGLGVFSFSATSPEVHVHADAAADPALVRETFSRTLEPVMLQAQGWQAIHASAILGAGGVVALAGLSRSGKSTVAFALGQRSFVQFADDVVLLSVGDVDVLAHARPFAQRLRPASRRHFESGAALRRQSPVTDPRPAISPVRAVIVLHQRADAGPVETVTCDGPRAFRELLTHAHCFDVEHAASTARLSADYLVIASRVVVSTLTYSSGLNSLPEVLDAVLSLASAAGVHPTVPSGASVR